MSHRAVVVLLVCLLCVLPAVTVGKLQVGFYKKTCPNAEALVRQAVAAAFAKNQGIAAGLIRMHFHDCFVRGCDGSVLLVSANGTAERDAPPNNPSLRGFEVVDAAKAAVEKACPRTVSCADILAFAARDSVALTGNLAYSVPAGRRDGSVSVDQDALDNLPPPFFTARQLVDRFKNKTLTAEDMVVLSGAHTLGRSHCTSFLDRIYNGTTPIVDAGLSPAYAALLQALCPANASQFTPTTTAIDVSTPAVLDSNYYKLLPLRLGLFFSDDQLTTDATLNSLVTTFARREAAWKKKFAAAMVKMGNIEVLTGRQGEIRLNCSVVNKPSAEAAAEAAVTYYSASGVAVDEVATS